MLTSKGDWQRLCAKKIPQDNHKFPKQAADPTGTPTLIDNASTSHQQTSPIHYFNYYPANLNTSFKTLVDSLLFFFILTI
jgi:hypothetical protein